MTSIASKARPYFGAVVLTTALLTAGGIWSATRMPSGVYPEVTFPRIAVVAKKSGLDLRGMELRVTIPLEQAVSTVLGVVQVRSKTIRGGSPSQLRDYAFYQLAPAIKNIPDVLYCNVAGGDIREIEVEVRPDDLLAAGLSAADLADQIAKQNRLQPVGRIEEPPLAWQI